MALNRKKYTKEEIETAVRNSNCYSDIFRQLGIKINGGSYCWIKSLLVKYGIEVNFEKGNENLRKAGIEATQRKKQRLYGDVSELESNGHRSNAKKLRAFLLFKGREEKCEVCGIDEWNGAKIRLDIHHLDGNCFNNHFDNLQFICPNCHRQETIRYKEGEFCSLKDRSNLK